MKSIHLLALAGGLLCATLQSCEFTNLSPETFVNEEGAFRDVESVGKLVTGTFGKLNLQSSMGISEYIADDLIQGSDAGGAGTNLYGWTYAADGESGGIWSAQYSIINSANRIIHKGAEVKATSEAEQKQLNAHFGQAYFVRALAHFELLRFFSDFQNPEALGIPYVTYYHVLGKPGRDKVSTCYDLLIDDLDMASELIDNSNKVYATQAAIKALTARIYLYQKNYAMAAIYATEALNLVPLEKAEKFAEIWTDKTRDGVIFVLPRAKGNRVIGGLFVGGDNSSVFRPSDEVKAVYTDGDVRKTSYIGRGPDRSGNIVDRVEKYIGSAGAIGLNDEKMFRSAEMELIIIESNAKNKRETEANKRLNEFRKLRIKDYAEQNYTGQALVDEILKERRRELFCEGERFFDLRRHKQGIKRSNGNELPYDHFRWIMPIPTSELQANEAISKQQNPGY